ncbi:MAG TPA: hypothetical protein V6D17_06735 [Candidatus Obscuribacterales bacterium]
MPMHLRVSALTLLFSIPLVLAQGQNAALGADLKGKVEEFSGTAGSCSGETCASSGKFLQGGIKEDAALRAWVRIVPGLGHALSAGGNGIAGQVVQFAGSAQYSPGQTTPPFRGLQPQKGVWTATPGVRTYGGVIPAISSYELRPANTLLYAPPRCEVAPATFKGVTSWAPGFAATKVNVSDSSTACNSSDRGDATTYKGVTSWMPDCKFSIDSGTKAGLLSGATTFNYKGVTVFDPSFKCENLDSRATKRESAVGSYKGVTAWTPGYNVSVVTSNNGVICWTPGRQVSVEVPGMIKNTLGGLWAASTQTPVPLRAAPGRLTLEREAEKVVAVPLPLTTTALSLPGVSSGTATNWEQWYKSVATAIYGRWQYAEVIPGHARVRVTVESNRNVSCELVSFNPVPDISRDVTAETNFRESAVKAVKLVNRWEIPEFPSYSDRQSVTFEVELKRTVDGPCGIDVPSLRAAK